MIQTTTYSVSMNFFPDHKESMIGYIEAVTGIGLIMGPLLGSVLYSLGGYDFIFYSFGGFFLLISFFVKLLFSAEIDGDAQTNSVDDDFLKVPEEAEQAIEAEDFVDEKHPTINIDNVDADFRPVGACDLLGNTRFVFASLSGMLGYFLYGFLEPILAMRVKEFDLTQVQIGVFFIVMPIFYIPVSSVVVPSLPSSISKRAIMILGALASFFGNLLQGPSFMFGIPDSLTMVLLGQIAHGIVDPFLLIPSLPEMLESVLPLYPGQETQVNNLSSALFNSFLGLGQVLGPTFGALVTQKYGFQACCDCVSVISLIFAILYYTFGDGYSAFKDSVWCDQNLHEEDVEIYQDDESVVVKAKIELGYDTGVRTPVSNPAAIMSVNKLLRKHAERQAIEKIEKFAFDTHCEFNASDLASQYRSESSAFGRIKMRK